MRPVQRLFRKGSNDHCVCCRPKELLESAEFDLGSVVGGAVEYRQYGPGTEVRRLLVGHGFAGGGNEGAGERTQPMSHHAPLVFGQVPGFAFPQHTERAALER